MENQDTEQRNFVVLDGEIVNVFPPKSDKAPTAFVIKNTRNYNGKTWEERIFGKTFHHDAVRQGAIVHAIGSLRTNVWEKDGTTHRDLEVMFNSIEELGFNTQPAEDRPLTQAEVIAETKKNEIDETVPTEIPKGEVNFDDIPF